MWLKLGQGYVAAMGERELLHTNESLIHLCFKYMLPTYFWFLYVYL